MRVESGREGGKEGSTEDQREREWEVEENEKGLEGDR